jgi:hypothetical protein
MMTLTASRLYVERQIFEAVPQHRPLFLYVPSFEHFGRHFMEKRTPSAMGNIRSPATLAST